MSYPTSSQKKFKGAYENRGVKREKIIICFKLNIKDDNIFYTDVYTMAIKIFTSHKKMLKNVYALLIKKALATAKQLIRKNSIFCLENWTIFFLRVNIEIGLSPLPLLIFSFTFLRTQLRPPPHSTYGKIS